MADVGRPGAMMTRLADALGGGRLSDLALTALTLNLLSHPVAGGWRIQVAGSTLSAPSLPWSLTLWAGLVAWRALRRHWHPALPGQLWAGAWRNRFPIALTALFLVALGLRLWGNSFGLPVITHPDEPSAAGSAIRMLKSGWFNPNWFYYPTLYMYLLMPFFALYFISLRGSGAVVSLAQVSDLEPGFYLIARSVSAVMGALTVFLLYRLATRLWDGQRGRRAGLIAATILTFSFIHARAGHNAVTDATLTFMVAAALIAVTGVLRRGTSWDYLLSGLLIGLAGSTKYSAVPMVLVVLAAHLMGRPRNQWISRKVFLAVSGLVAGFLAGTPYALLNWRTFLNHMGFLRTISSSMIDPMIRFKYLVGYSFESGFRPWVGVALWSSLLLALHRRRRRELLLAIHALAFIALIADSEIRIMPRYWLPALPAIAVLVGGYAAAAADWLQRQLKLSAAVTVLALAVIVGIAVFPTARETIEWDQLYTRPDSRAVAYLWLGEHFDKGTIVSSEARIRGVPRGIEINWSKSLQAVSVNGWRRRGVSVLLFSDEMDTAAERDKQTARRRKRLKANLILLRRFPGFADGQLGPGLTAYALPPPVDTSEGH